MIVPVLLSTINYQLLTRVQHIPGSAHGFNNDRRASQLVAQVAHVYIHDIRVRFGIAAPNVVPQIGARDDLAGIDHKVFQQLVLPRCQGKRLVIARDAPPFRVEFQISHAQALTLGGRLPRRSSARTRASSSSNANGFTR